MVSNDRSSTGARDESGDDLGCPKCGHDEATTETVSTTGSLFGELLDVQGRPFTVVICERCRYSEFYSGSHGVVDLFLGRGYREGSPATAEVRSGGDLSHCSMCGGIVDPDDADCPHCGRSFVA
ncbi:hypothetical protein BRC94_11525 [Halobacteriales archaeon QS_5_70_17]|nr:MAG: hypothetical protein BRC94_11525 [Halobacteriales archaeon QS_5_70_17]